MNIELPIESLSDRAVWQLGMLLSNGAEGCLPGVNAILASLGETCRAERARRMAIDLMAADKAMRHADPLGSVWNEPWRDQNGVID